MSINNSVRLIGRLTRDLEVGTTTKNMPFGKSAIAVDEGYKGADGQWVNKAMFVDIIVWGEKPVNYLKERLKKGTLVAIEGKLEINNYTNKEGVKRMSVSVRVSESKVLESRKNATNGFNQNAANNQYNPVDDFANQSYDPSDFAPMDDGGDIPF